MSELANRENDQSPRYVYEALQPGQIRLLHVVSCSDVRTECELRHVELDTDEDWYALSYVWGNADPECEVLLNGKILPIRRNLLAALKALQYLQDELSRAYWIWIDAICINQDDDVEKSEQVPSMSKIYRGAFVVMIWLGNEQDCPQIVVEVFHFLWALSRLIAARGQDAEEDAASNVAGDEQQPKKVEIMYWSDKYQMALYELQSRFGVSMDQMLALAHFRLELLLSCANDPDRLTREATKKVLETSRYKGDFLPPSHPFWKGLIAFAEHEWPRRVWTMQEFWLGRDTVLLTSHGVVDWKFILDFLNLSVLGSSVHEIISMEYVLATGARGHPIYELSFGFNVGKFYGGQPTKPARLLLELGHRKASLPKDYVYGLLGLLDAESKSSIKVDYSASDAKVFVDAMRAAVGLEPQYPWLGLLWNHFEITLKTIEGLPSWCPDFSSMNRSLINGGRNGFLIDDSVRKKYSPAQVDLECDEWTLGFAGVRLDKVLQSVPKSFSLLGREVFTANAEAHFEICLNVEFHQYLECLRSMFCTASGNLETGARSFLRSFYPSDKYIETFERIIWFCGEVLSRSIESPLAAAEILDLDIEDVNQLVLCVYRFSTAQANKFFFKTKSGKMGFSWVPHSPGDNVIYVPGGPCLSLVSEDGCRYVGTAYVEGFEGDSLLDILPAFDDEWEMFYVS